MIKHAATHTDEHPIKCPHCCFSATINGVVTKHIMDYHTMLGLFKCSTCSLFFRNGEELAGHTCAPAPKPLLACSFQNCDYTTYIKSNLRRHVCTHTGLRQFQCPSCFYKATTQDCLKTHMRTHTGYKPYACTKCAATFSRRPKRHACKGGAIVKTDGAVLVT